MGNDEKRERVQSQLRSQPLCDDKVLFVLTCSDESRANFLLRQLDDCARLRREVYRLLSEWVEAESRAKVAEWAREIRSADTDTATAHLLPGHLESD